MMMNSLRGLREAILGRRPVDNRRRLIAQAAAIHKRRESQSYLMWMRFKRHKLAIVSAAIIILLYFGAVFNRFLSPYEMESANTDYIHAPPTKIRLAGDDGFSLRPFVYATVQEKDAFTGRRRYVEDAERRHYIRFFVRGYQWRVLGVFPTDVHLFGVDEGARIFLLGTDFLGRDLFSRILYGSLISLSIGWVGMLIGLTLGTILGSISGIFGGAVDMVIQRWNEVLMSYPDLPLWIALAAAIPSEWSSIQVYFTISVILSVISTGGLSRVLRGKVLSLRENEYVLASIALGASTARTVRKHIIPGLTSYLLVRLTLSIPGMILGESALGFLGLGIRPPMASWGTLMQEAQKISSVAHHPWLLLPGLFIVVTVLAFSFVGDGVRDMADPYVAK